MSGNVTRQTDSLLRLAVQHHNAGQTERAERFYREILRLDPQHCDAAHLLGHIVYQDGRRKAATALFVTAARGNATVGSYHLALGQALLDEGRAGPALAAARRAVALSPDDADALCLLGAAAGRLGKPVPAFRAFNAAVRLVPDAPEPRLGLGGALEDLRRIDAAIGCYRLAVRLRPEDVGGWIALANALRRWSRPAEAVAAYQEALKRNVTNASVWTNLGATWQSLGQHGHARESYNGALRYQPDNVEARNNLGLLLHAQGRHADARACFAAVLAVTPHYLPALVNLGLAEAALGRFDRAVALYRRALGVDRRQAEAWNNLGNALKATGRRDEAAACWKRALALNPGFADALGNLGAEFRDREQFAQAVPHLRRGVRLMPGHAPLRAVLAYTLSGECRFLEAARACRQALALEPALADPLCTLGLVEQRIGMPNARRWFDRAVAAVPNHALARFNRGLVALEQGALTTGWADYASRFQAGRARPSRRFTIPEWRGEPLDGKRLFVWREQGVGDEFLFASCYADAIRLAGAVVIECERRLVPLFTRSFPRALVRAEQPLTGLTEAETVDCDYHIPAGSLPRLLRDRLGQFPARSSWLFPDGTLAADWRERLDSEQTGLLVGISWRSQMMTQERQSSYLPLDAWGPVFAVPGVTFVNLQYDECRAEIAQAEARFGCPIYGWTGLDLRDDFEETAALISNLDLVIAPANSVAELSGALGVPVWRFGHRDWTHLGTGGRPWYPSMRVFQPLAGQGLDDVMARIAGELRRLPRVDGKAEKRGGRKRGR
ncbi:tetratricopeptide repeat protein [Azospirillum doebereinerae]|uniref:Tetratricopeptide repeat protein n=1 Tax=Azospirillum doebereinerae TaxID=92933 RepID=A0A3S0UZ69_9PROT|nr:tetratricopeptide repeat protein [Azospirillum doebereinerae]RUQ66517.1 tetratricopeptide repeat protein [Azospirillum doebereinerae]